MSVESPAPRGALGHILLTRGLLSPADLQFALRWQHSLNRQWPVQRLGSLLVKSGVVPMNVVLEVLCEQRGVFGPSGGGVEIPRKVAPWLRGIFPPDLLRRLGAVPLYIAGSTLVVGMIDPQREDQVALLRAHTGYEVQPMLLLQYQADKLLRRLYLMGDGVPLTAMGSGVTAS